MFCGGQWWADPRLERERVACGCRTGERPQDCPRQQSHHCRDSWPSGSRGCNPAGAEATEDWLWGGGEAALSREQFWTPPPVWRRGPGREAPAAFLSTPLGSDLGRVVWLWPSVEGFLPSLLEALGTGLAAYSFCHPLSPECVALAGGYNSSPCKRWESLGPRLGRRPVQTLPDLRPGRAGSVPGAAGLQGVEDGRPGVGSVWTWLSGSP